MLSENLIIDNWQEKKCLVSICCLTYNHELFIEQCLKNLLNQITDFGFEILIHDDASQDKTQGIIKKYAEQYPKIIKPILQTENQRSKINTGMNPKFNYPRAAGKYIAFCEGDDYWIDPYKLQKQVAILNTNHDIGCVVTDYDKLIENKSVYNEKVLSKTFKTIQNGIISAYPLFSIALKKTRTVTAMVRMDCINEFQKKDFLKGVPGDTQLFGYLLLTTKIYFKKESTAVYRILNESVSHTNSFAKKQQFMKSFNIYMAHIIANYNLPRADKKYYQKSIRLFKIRAMAHEQKRFQTLIESILFVLNGHLSKLIIPQIKIAFKNKDE
jgi:glycosyltransferase involved in cell wall biosynthesis